MVVTGYINSNPADEPYVVRFGGLSPARGTMIAVSGVLSVGVYANYRSGARNRASVVSINELQDDLSILGAPVRSPVTQVRQDDLAEVG